MEAHHARVRGQLARYRGEEVDTAGDGFFATFDGPARAVRCAESIAAAVQPLGVEVRAGVHTGEVELIDGKVGGLAVVIGARVGAMAGPSEVLVSQTVKDLTAGSGLTFEDAGEHELKGVPDRWHLYRVVADAPRDTPPTIWVISNKACAFALALITREGSRFGPLNQLETSYAWNGGTALAYQVASMSSSAPPLLFAPGSVTHLKVLWQEPRVERS